MNFRDWKYWLNNLPWSLRWFVWIVLLRPIIDNFYYLKNISVFLSPLYIVGVLTPILCVNGIYAYSIDYKSTSDRYFTIFSYFLIIGSAAFLISEPLIKGIEGFIRISLPVFLFFFIRRFIYSRTDLYGLFYTFLIASYIAGAFLLYELIFHPIQDVEYSRGLQRYRGGYADVMNYAIYTSFGLLITLYFYLKKIKITIFSINNLYLFIPLSLLILFKITHMASYIIYGSLLILFFYYFLRGNFLYGLILIIFFIGLLWIYGGTVLHEKIDPLIEKDILVIEGQRGNEALLHGRVGRWQYLLAIFSNYSPVSKIFGIWIQKPNLYLMGAGVHNDFLRILFSTGYFGLIIYMLFYFIFIKRIFQHEVPEGFLLSGTLIIILLYSVSTTPTYYPNLLYISFAIISFFSLPVENIYEEETEDTPLG